MPSLNRDIISEEIILTRHPELSEVQDAIFELRWSPPGENSAQIWMTTMEAVLLADAILCFKAETEKPTRKVIQMAHRPSGDWICLCNDGTLWEIVGHAWFPLPGVPQP
jgi:hypothetical protein